MDFEPGCANNQIKLTLYESRSITNIWEGQWDPIIVQVESLPTAFKLTLKFKTLSWFSKGKLLNNQSITIPYESLLLASESQPK